MESLFEQDDELVNFEEVTGSTKASPGHKRTDFKPWHKPRKQWVRDMQWWESIDRLLSSNNVTFQNVDLKYFGLPGGDLLDIEFLRQNLAKSPLHRNKKIAVHGFIDNQEDKAAADVRLSQLLDLENICNQSKVERFNFGALENENSEGYRRIKELGPYHFINLDFCGSAFRKETLGALMRLIHSQFARIADTPWLLCITTRTNRESIVDDAFLTLDKLLAVLEEDTSTDKVKEYFSNTIDAIENTLLFTSDELNGEAFSDLFKVCFILWIISLSLENFKAKIELVSSMKYTVNPENNFADMTSLVFRVHKADVLAPDPYGVVEAEGMGEAGVDAETQLTIKCNALIRLRDSLNIDNYLEANIPDFEKCLDDMKELLKVSGWDVTNYEEFARAEH